MQIKGIKSFAGLFKGREVQGQSPCSRPAGREIFQKPHVVFKQDLSVIAFEVVSPFIFPKNLQKIAAVKLLLTQILPPARTAPF